MALRKSAKRAADADLSAPGGAREKRAGALY